MSHVLDGRDRALAWEATRLLLDEVGLATYLFAIELAGDDCTAEVEYPQAGAWRPVTLRVRRAELLATLDDARRRVELAESWRNRLARDAA